MFEQYKVVNKSVGYRKSIIDFHLSFFLKSSALEFICFCFFFRFRFVLLLRLWSSGIFFCILFRIRCSNGASKFLHQPNFVPFKTGHIVCPVDPLQNLVVTIVDDGRSHDLVIELDHETAFLFVCGNLCAAKSETRN